MDIRDRRLKARLSKWSTCSVETKRGLVKPRKVIMLKRFLSYYKPQMGLFVADTVCALVLAAIDLAFPIILRNLTGGLFTQGQAAIMQALGIEQKQFPINMIRSKISSAKNAMIGPEDMLKSADSPNDKKAAQVYLELERRLRAANAMDFDDLLLQTNILLRDAPDVLARYQELFKYILVDAYQDTNYAQYVIIRRLSQLHSKVCVVGVDGRWLYSFGGAKIE